MIPVLVLVGQPNVGKSTLFNCLTHTRDALVADFPGTTRDRHYGQGRIGKKPYLIVDTGGFEPVAQTGMLYRMARQTQQAVDEADCIVFLADARKGVTPQDVSIATYLRKTGRPVCIVANKAEGLPYSSAAADFYAFGFGDPYVISSAHGQGVCEMVDAALDLCVLNDDKITQHADDQTASTRPKIAIVGRPNVGKSSLANLLIGEERMIAFDLPGTTRDAIAVELERSGQKYTLIDTAGIRRRSKITETIEKFSIIKTLQSIAQANVVILLLDAHQDIAEQDAHIARFIVDAGRALVIGVNKWDGLGAYDRERVKVNLTRQLQFLDFAQINFISVIKKTGINALMRAVDHAYIAAMSKLSTPKLTRILIDAVKFQPPPRHGPIRPKLRYAHQGGHNPPTIVIHGNALDMLSKTYQRYLERRFRDACALTGTPLRLMFRSSVNPYARSC
jgi:GTPase